MPWDEDVLGFKGLLGLHQGLCEHLSVVGHGGVHVVDQEWLGEMVFVVGEWHGLEVKGHGGSALDITDLVHAGSGVGVSVEELSSLGSVLWEIEVASARVPLLIVIDNMIGLWAKQLSDFLVGEQSIEHMNFIDGWLSSLVSDSGQKGHGSNQEVDLPDEGLGSHEEADGSPSEESACPAIVGSVKSGSDLIEIVGSSHSQFPVVSLENVTAVGELGWISLGLLWLESIGTSDGGVELEEVAIVTLRWLESLVVPAWVSVESSTVEFTLSFFVVVSSSSKGSHLHVSHSRSGKLSTKIGSELIH